MLFDVKQFEARGTFHGAILSKLEPESNQLLELITILEIYKGKENEMNDATRKQLQNMVYYTGPLILLW